MDLSFTEEEEAFATEVGRGCAEDRRILAPGEGDSTMLLFDEELVFPVAPVESAIAGQLNERGDRPPLGGPIGMLV